MLESIVDRAAADEPALRTEARPAQRECLGQIQCQVWDGAEVLRTVLASAVDGRSAAGVDEGVQRAGAEETRRTAGQQAKHIRQRGLVVDVEVNTLGLLRGGRLRVPALSAVAWPAALNGEVVAELLIAESAQVANRRRGQGGDRVVYLDVASSPPRMRSGPAMDRSSAAGRFRRWTSWRSHR